MIIFVSRENSITVRCWMDPRISVTNPERLAENNLQRSVDGHSYPGDGEEYTRSST
jgi:hypothetical protein